METVQHDTRNSICSEDAVSLASNGSPDNTSRTSSNYDEQSQSDSSEVESDHDEGEPDIDQMLSELEGFQVVRSYFYFM